MRFSGDNRIWGLIVLALLLLTGACSGVSRPFSKALTPPGKTPPAITLTAMNGIPPAKADILFNELSRLAGKRDIAIVRGSFQNGYSMTGVFNAIPQAGGTLVTFRWQLLNQNRQVIENIDGNETALLPGADPWSGVRADSLRRIAAFTAENLATRLNQMGYATRLTGLPPREDTKMAGPGAEKDLDYETIYGPGSVAPNVAALTPAVNQPLPAEAKAPVHVRQANREIAKPVKTASIRKPKAKARGKVKKINAVAMTSVTGSPGNGNRELLGAMRGVMRKAGWPVLTRPRNDALIVTGKVKLAPPAGKTQKVALAWTVRTPDGKVLGTVRQANNVPAGSLDRGWGAAAKMVSQAAAVGIFKLVQKTR